MSQPPAGGYPPPDPSQPGGYPPPAPGYQPPPSYTPPSAPAPGGYQPPPAPGYAPPPAGGYAPPPGAQGGYPPPAGNYPPPAPGYGNAPAPAGGGMPSIDISKVTVIGWGIIGAAFLTLIASFFNFWSVSYTGALSAYASGGGLSGWTSWWWLPVLVALAVGVVYALTLFGIMKPGPIKPEFLFYGAVASFVLLILVLILTFSYGGSYYDSDIGGASSGPGFGIWFALVTSLALAYFTALSVQSKGGKLPFKVPGPAV